VVKVQSTTLASPEPEVVETEEAAAKTPEPASTDFGATLRQARVKRGVSLAEIANASKISIAVLEELEHNNISRLPQGILGRGFIRSYATQVGLEPEATVAEFVARFPTESVTAGYQTLEQQIEEEQFEDKRRWSLRSLGRWAGAPLDRWSRPSPLLMAFAAGVILLAACPLYLRRERLRPANARNSPGAAKAQAGARGLALRPSPVGTPAAVETHRETTAFLTSTESSRAALERPALPPESWATRAESQTQTPAIGEYAPEKPAGEQSVTEKRTIETSQIANAETGGLATEIPVKEKLTQEEPAKVRRAAKASRLAVVLSVTRPSWIIASVDGKRAVNRLLLVGEHELLDANSDLLLTTGDAGAVVMTVNGAAVRPIGRPGQTITVHLNPTNLKKFLAS
jgi:cytoskeleton protein RodZ